ncbi:MAG: HEAT repeat domain-containing protein [Candidatus Latescibacterota bacterium]|nr:MAG: HEAT repeat domain-containing protein [Candidatus Latescibacterota bacterium]
MRRLLPALLVLLSVLPATAETPEEEAGRYAQTLVSSIREKNDPMRNRMFMKLRVLGNASVGALLASIGDESPEVRHYVAFTLGFFDEPRVPEALLTAFRADPDLDVRCAAAEALGRLRVREAIAPLIAALSDPEAELRQSAAYSLGLIGDPEARSALEQAKGDTDELVRFFAGEALVEIERELARSKR